MLMLEWCVTIDHRSQFTRGLGSWFGNQPVGQTCGIVEIRQLRVDRRLDGFPIALGDDRARLEQARSLSISALRIARKRQKSIPGTRWAV